MPKTMSGLKELIQQHELQRYILDEIETEMFCLQDGITKTAKEIEATVSYNMDYLGGKVKYKMEEDITVERILGRVDAFKQVLQMLHDNILDEMEKNKL